MNRRSRQPSLFDNASLLSVAEVFDPARLTQARTLASMTKQDLAAEVGVSAAAIGQYESGIIAPRAEHVAALARALEVPPNFLAAGRPRVHLDSSMAHFRSLRSTRTAQRAKASACAEQVWELCHALELRVELPDVDLPAVPGDGVSAEEAARLLRKQWNLPAGPVKHLVRTLEIHGIVVAWLPVATADETVRVDAFSTSKLPRPLIVLTPDRVDDVFRHRFSAAHELGHLVLHEDARPGDAEQEREADRFAAEFLTPAAEIGVELPGQLRLPALEPIGRKWGVSVESLVRRIAETGVASDVSVRRAYQRLRQLRSSGLLRPEPVQAYPGEVPSMLSKAFDLVSSCDGLTEADLAGELAWPEKRVSTLLGRASRKPALRLVKED